MNNGFTGQTPTYATQPLQLLGQVSTQNSSSIMSASQVPVSGFSHLAPTLTPYGLPSVIPQPPPLPKDKHNLLPVKHNAFYNVNPILAKNILNSRYFQSLFEKTTLWEVKEEINSKVDHVEPFVTTTGAASNTASTAFCLLYKLFTMRLNKKQVYSVISSKNTSFVRALGFLYLRYILEAEELWNYFEEFIDDETQFCPYNRDKSHKLSIGEFAKKLLCEQKYFETLLPRIPKLVEVELQVKLIKKLSRSREEGEWEEENKEEGEGEGEEESNRSEMGKTGEKKTKKSEYEVGEIIEARYSVDGKWYEAKVLQVLKQQQCAIVEYMEYEDDNTETVSFKHMRKVVKTDTNSDDKDKDLRRRILEKQREEATTGTKSEYAKRIVTFKRTISVPLNPKSVSKELNESGRQYGSRTGELSIDEILKKQGRVGNSNKQQREDDDDQEDEVERERKRKQRKEELEKIYGNEANKKPKTR